MPVHQQLAAMRMSEAAGETTGPLLAEDDWQNEDEGENLDTDDGVVEL